MYASPNPMAMCSCSIIQYRQWYVHAAQGGCQIRQEEETKVEGKGKAMSRMRPFSCLFLSLSPPPRIRRTYFGRHASEPEIRTACAAAYSLLASQHLDPLPLGNIILSALQKDGERGTKLQPIASCYGIK